MLCLDLLRAEGVQRLVAGPQNYVKQWPAGSFGGSWAVVLHVFFWNPKDGGPMG